MFTPVEGRDHREKNGIEYSIWRFPLVEMEPQSEYERREQIDTRKWNAQARIELDDITITGLKHRVSENEEETWAVAEELADKIWNLCGNKLTKSNR